MFLINTRKAQAPLPRPHLLLALGHEGRAQASRFLLSCPRHRPTPLHALPALAARLGLASLHVKDEGYRLGLTSFKALGGAYAVMRLVADEAARRWGRTIDPAEMQSPGMRAIAAGMTMVCATDGNHGRAVAAGARLVGCRSIIFIHEGVSEPRAAAIAAFGGEIVRVAGSYDDSVVEAARQASRHGWTVVSDTSWEGYEDIPLTVMQGYTVTAGEAFEKLLQPPTHIFIQAGVGGVAAAVAAHALAVYGQAMPKIVIVEPERAACLLASAEAGRVTTVAHGLPTVMAMLECAEPSPLAFEIVQSLAEGFVAVSEDSAIVAMNELARPAESDCAIIAGESGAAGLAGLMTCLDDETARTLLELGHTARVLLFNTEGATDAALYEKLTGIDPARIPRTGPSSTMTVSPV